MQRKAQIKVDKLTYHYGTGPPVLKDISFEIEKGECIALIGQNGAGKTTLAKHFNGLHRPSSGKVYIDGTDTASMKVSELARKVGFVFQNPDHQIFHDTVAREVAFGLKNLRLSPREIEERTAAALEAVGLAEHRQTYPFNLSKGQRQRVALASVLAMRTEIIVLDEPTTGQDFRESVQIMEIVRKLNENGHTIIFITHDIGLSYYISDSVYIMEHGRFVESGTADEVILHPKADYTKRLISDVPKIYEPWDLTTV